MHEWKEYEIDEPGPRTLSSYKYVILTYNICIYLMYTRRVIYYACFGARGLPQRVSRRSASTSTTLAMRWSDTP